MKRMKRFHAIAACLLLCCGMAIAETKTVTFDFSTVDGLLELGVTPPSASSTSSTLPAAMKLGDITLVPGATPPRSTYYRDQYTFYSRSGESFSFVGDEGVTITRITFNGFYARQNLSASPQGFDSGNAYWSGSASQVTFTGTGGNSLFTMTVTYDIESQTFLSGDVDGNGIVNGSDVTALYNYLLNGITPAGATDVDGNSTTNGSDVTALYNILLSDDEMPVDAPTFNYPSGTVFNTPGSTVVIIGQPNCDIYITLDGSTPTTTRSKIRAARRITSMCPRVTGSKLPG